ncbi:MAG: peptidase M20 [Burkholderiales bacterium]|nr:peptidase M20 [Burkholderiales bacterium]
MKIKLICVACVLASAPCLAADAPQPSQEVMNAAQAIYNDPAVQSILKEATSLEGQKWRFNNHMELVRIISPSRSEMRRQQEIAKRLSEDWGFDAAEVMAPKDGHLPGAGLQTVDGLPVYNVCVVFPGTYKNQPDAKSYKGQFPKVLLEGHIDTVYPPELPPESNPYASINLQPVTEPIVKTKEERAALPQLHFDEKGRIIEDENYQKAYQRYDNAKEAAEKNALRIYVPGYNDAMINTTAVLQAAYLMNKYGIKPVYDVWVCGTTGEEGKGNLDGMKQLYGYSQDVGKGNNALNFVANFGADSTTPYSGTMNYLGSYRFEMKYKEPKGQLATDKTPSALMAASRAIESIANVKTPFDANPKGDRISYSVGVAECTPAPEGGRSEECTIMVDMRSPQPDSLNAMRKEIEPKFAKAVEEENAAYGLKEGDKNAVTAELVWFGDRPAYKRSNYDDVASVAWLAAPQTVGVDVKKEFSDRASSLNDNVPAAVGVPTVNVNVGTNAGGGGGHTWYEWGVPGNGVEEGKRVVKLILMGLLASGYNTTDGKVIAPLAPPEGNRTTEEIFN